MELDITKCSVVCCGTPEEKKAVLPVECSMILPDSATCSSAKAALPLRRRRQCPER